MGGGGPSLERAAQFGNGGFPVWERGIPSLGMGNSQFGRDPGLGGSPFWGGPSLRGKIPSFGGFPVQSAAPSSGRTPSLEPPHYWELPNFPNLRADTPKIPFPPPSKSPFCPFKNPPTPKPTAPPGGPAVSPKPRPFPFGRARASLGLFRRPGGDGCEGRGGEPPSLAGALAPPPPHWPVRSRRFRRALPIGRSARAAGE